MMQTISTRQIAPSPPHVLTLLLVQAEVAAVNAERERIRSSAAHSLERIAALETELDVAKQVGPPRV